MELEPELCRVEDSLSILVGKVETNYLIAFIEERYSKIQ